MYQATQSHNYVLHRLITTATYLPLSGQSQIQWWLEIPSNVTTNFRMKVTT
ncbi:hypothetical protein SAMN04488109_6821 [Chryseolinea serpens]|uniref:Uncharacterized protein n=1 Tax=Chryseolinea serpens TaxID=947013 RepID=A0A1M5XSF6_9BACT|nr:hypothetical protein SAMN04488109_6821 [Chryseolinea serpens]